MRKITKDAISAFNSRQDFKRDNTEVTNFDGVTRLELHGNCIATFRPEIGLSVSSGGWRSNPTKERLNGLEGVSVRQSAGVWYLNGKQWDGQAVTVDIWNMSEGGGDYTKNTLDPLGITA